MILIDAILSYIFPTDVLPSIYSSVFIAACLANALARSHNLLLGLGLGLINTVIAIALYFWIVPPVPLSVVVLPPALVSIFSGLMGGAAGARMKAWFIAARSA